MAPKRWAENDPAQCGVFCGCEMSSDQPDDWYAREFDRAPRAGRALNFGTEDAPVEAPAYKQCARCRSVMHVSKFSRNLSGYLGRHSVCKGCRAELGREKYQRARL